MVPNTITLPKHRLCVLVSALFGEVACFSYCHYGRQVGESCERCCCVVENLYHNGNVLMAIFSTLSIWRVRSRFGYGEYVLFLSLTAMHSISGLRDRFRATIPIIIDDHIWPIGWKPACVFGEVCFVLTGRLHVFVWTEKTYWRRGIIPAWLGPLNSWNNTWMYLPCKPSRKCFANTAFGEDYKPGCFGERIEAFSSVYHQGGIVESCVSSNQEIDSREL